MSHSTPQEEQGKKCFFHDKFFFEIQLKESDLSEPEILIPLTLVFVLLVIIKVSNYFFSFFMLRAKFVP